MRKAEIKRKTGETDIAVAINLDGMGASKINTGCPFLDHMLTLFSKHSRIDLEVSAVGDVEVDYHHTTEDVGIALGAAIKEALGDMRGIRRYGDRIIPMDEALVMSAVDISGRAHLEYSAKIPSERVGGFDTELCEEFFSAFVRKSEITLHIRSLAGTNSHHIIECIFKSVARSLGDAVAIDERFSGDVPSTKGVI